MTIVGKCACVSALMVAGLSSAFSTGGFQYDSLNIAQTLTQRFSTRFIEFHFSKAFAELDSVKAHAETYDHFCDDVIQNLHLAAPGTRIKCFLYSSDKEMRDCLGIDGGGWAIGDEIHTLGLFPIQHECFHVLFDGSMGQSGSQFFAEGIGQYFESTRDSQMVSRDRAIVNKFLDQPIESWADGTKDFWDSPKDGWITVTYSISAIFVRDLIQEFGLDRFKEFFRLIGNDSARPVADGFKQVYGMTLHEAVTSFANRVQSTQQ